MAEFVLVSQTFLKSFERSNFKDVKSKIENLSEIESINIDKCTYQVTKSLLKSESSLIMEKDTLDILIYESLKWAFSEDYLNKNFNKEITYKLMMENKKNFLVSSLIQSITEFLIKKNNINFNNLKESNFVVFNLELNLYLNMMGNLILSKGKFK